MTVSTSPWADLLAGDEVAYLGSEPARTARTAAIPDALHPRVRESLAALGIDELFTHQRAAWDAAAAGRHVIVTTGTASGKTLAFNLPVLDALAREPKLRALYLYPTKALAQDQARQLAAFRLPKLRPAIYDGDTPGRAPLADPALVEPDPDQPGHAPRGRAPAPRPVGRRALEPALHRGRRGARLPRRLRIARGQRAAAAAPAGPDLRRRAAAAARLGDDREPRRARAAARRRGGGGDRRRRRAAGRAHDLPVEPRAARRGAGPARQRARRRGPPAGRARRGRAAHAHVREEPEGGRARPPLHRRAARRRGAALALSRGLHARAAPRHRATSRRGRAARRERDERARAGDRRRAAGRGRLGGLSGHGVEPAPAVGARRPARARAGGAGGQRGRARPVLRPRP